VSTKLYFLKSGFTCVLWPAAHHCTSQVLPISQSFRTSVFGKGVQVQIVQNCLTAFLFLLGIILHIKMSCVMVCTDIVVTAEMVLESSCAKVLWKVLRTFV
jgi:hypothetical protein